MRATGQQYRLNSDTSVSYFNDEVATRRAAGKPPTVQFLREDRSLDQNAMINALYGQIAAQKEDESVVDVRRHCKAYFGIPILLAYDEAFSAMYTKSIMQHLTTEEKLLAMDILPVTSRMKKPQATEYIETVIREFSKQGLSLVNPNEIESYEENTK